MRFAAAIVGLLAFATCELFATSDENAILSRIHRQTVSSTVLASVGYSKRLHALEVEFRTGAIYRYLEVPEAVYRELMAAPSKAAYYDANVRHCYRSVHVRPRSG